MFHIHISSHLWEISVWIVYIYVKLRLNSYFSHSLLFFSTYPIFTNDITIHSVSRTGKFSYPCFFWLSWLSYLESYWFYHLKSCWHYPFLFNSFPPYWSPLWLLVLSQESSNALLLASDRSIFIGPVDFIDFIKSMQYHNGKTWKAVLHKIKKKFHVRNPLNNFKIIEKFEIKIFTRNITDLS